MRSEQGLFIHCTLEALIQMKKAILRMTGKPIWQKGSHGEEGNVWGPGSEAEGCMGMQGRGYICLSAWRANREAGPRQLCFFPLLLFFLLFVWFFFTVVFLLFFFFLCYYFWDENTLMYLLEKWLSGWEYSVTWVMLDYSLVSWMIAQACVYTVLGVLYTKLAAEDTGPQEADILEQETKQTVKPEFHSIWGTCWVPQFVCTSISRLRNDYKTSRSITPDN